MSSSSIGASMALATAVFWALSPFCFASAARRIGSLPVAVIRVIFAAALLLILLLSRSALRGTLVPHAGGMAILMTIVSGLLGVGIGDMMGYEAFLLAGVQRTTLISTLAPVAAALCAWAAFGERLGPHQLVGVGLVVAGTAFALDNRYDGHHSELKPSAAGLALAVGSALCQGLGAVTLRWAYHFDPRMDPIFATTLRVASAAVFLVAICPIMRCNLHDAVRQGNMHAWKRIAIGTVVGPVVGMLCYVYALSLATAGLCSALSSASPLFVVAIAAVRFRKAPARIALAAAVTGVVILMLW